MIFDKIPGEKKNLFHIDQYILQLKSEGLSIDTINFYVSYLWCFIRFAKIESPLDFGNLVIIRFAYLSLFEKEKENLSNNTRIKYYNSIKKYSEFLREMEIIDNVQIIKIKRPKLAKTLPKSLDDTQIETLMNGLLKYNTGNRFFNVRNFVMIEVMIYTGMRRKEVSNLKIEDCKKEYITIREGKGQKDRAIPLPKRLQETIKGWLEYRTKIGGEYLFCDHHGKNLTADAISTLFFRIKQNIGMEVHPHLLRHTFASLCVKKGINIYTIQNAMGHASIETTSSYFAMTMKENFAEIQKLNY